MSLAFYNLGELVRAVECAEAALEILEWLESPDAEMVRKLLNTWRDSKKRLL